MNSSQISYEHLKEVREQKIEDLIKPTIAIEPSFTISRVIGMMIQNDSYDVFCVNGDSLLTTNARDLLTSRDIPDMKIGPLLHNIRTISKNDSVEKAATIMAHYRMRSVPVVENKQLLGTVNAKNIVELLAQQNLKWITANTILTPNPITLDSKESLAAARQLMVSKRIDHIPIIRNNKVGQVLTSMHLLQLLRPQERIGSDLKGVNPLKRFDSQVGNIGSTRVPQCNTNDSLNTMIDSMLKSDVTCCLVTLWDNLHGIITYKDLLNLLQTRISGEVPLYIIGLPEELDNAEIVKTKFQKIIRNLTKVYPEVEEARASIKTIHTALGQRKNFEVSVRIITPYRNYSYTEMGWDLSKVFGTLGSRIIRNLSKRSKRRWKMSVRKINKKDIF